MNKVVLLCRPGFEKECAAEITDKAGKRESMVTPVFATPILTTSWLA